MSVLFYAGRPGSGKSYDAVGSVVIPALRAGRAVLTNLPLIISELENECINDKVTFFSHDDVKNPLWWNAIPGGCLLVIDEAWRYWPKGTLQRNILPEVQGFFAEHRHRVGADGLSCEIVLISQDESQLARPVLALVEETYWHSDLSAVGRAQSFRVDVHAGYGKKGLKLNSFMGNYKSDVFRFYKSHTQAPDGVQGRELKADGRGNIFKGILFRWVLPGVAVLFLLGLFGVFKVFDSNNYVKSQGEDASAPARAPAALAVDQGVIQQRAAAEERRREVAVAAEKAEAVAAAERAQAEAQRKLEEESRWRISGDVFYNNVGWFYLESNDGRIVRLSRDQCQESLGDWSCDFQGLKIVSRPKWNKVTEVSKILAGSGGGFAR